MNKHWVSLRWSLLILLSGLLVAWRVLLWQQTVQQEFAQARFHDLAKGAAESLVQRMQVYQYGLRGARGAVISMGPEGLSREGFRRYSRSRAHTIEFTGARGFGFIRRVPVAQEAAFLAAARRDGKPDFAIRQLAAHNDERWVIQYIEPEANNRQAVGLDIASETNRRDAALQAMRSGQATLTHPITLVQASGMVKRGFLFMLPVYRGSELPATAAACDQMTYGLVYAPLVIDEVLANFDQRQESFSLTLFDQAQDGTLENFYRSTQQAHATAGVHERIPLELNGRHWLAEFQASQHFMDNLNLTPPSQYAVEIALLSLLLAGLLYGRLLILARKRDTLQQQARLAAIVAGANDAIIGMTLTARITDWNPAAEAIFGYPANMAIGHFALELIVPERLKDEEPQWLARMLAGEVVHGMVTRRRRADGSELDVSVTITPIRDANGTITGVAKTVRDISADVAAHQRILELNNALEHQVAQRTAHLQSALQELADFSYMASHDLRTPLRALDGFSNLLLRVETLSADTRADYLQRIRAAAQQMGRIIDDMVALTRIVRMDSRPEVVDLAVLAQAEIARLKALEPQREVVCVIQPTLSVLADPEMMRLLLAQLLDNAWKFSREMPDARIELMSHGGDDGWVECCVRDNGIGFDMAHAGRLFMPFQRLHHGDNQSGTGMGLAVAQRIVRKHGGDMRAEAMPGVGAAFFFTLPVPRSVS